MYTTDRAAHPTYRDLEREIVRLQSLVQRLESGLRGTRSQLNAAEIVTADWYERFGNRWWVAHIHDSIKAMRSGLDETANATAIDIGQPHTGRKESRAR